MTGWKMKCESGEELEVENIREFVDVILDNAMEGMVPWVLDQVEGAIAQGLDEGDITTTDVLNKIILSWAHTSGHLLGELSAFEGGSKKGTVATASALCDLLMIGAERGYNAQKKATLTEIHERHEEQRKAAMH